MILMTVLKNYFSVLIELTMAATAEAACEQASDDRLMERERAEQVVLRRTTTIDDWHWHLMLWCLTLI